jgi:DNA replication protein DnaC
MGKSRACWGVLRREFMAGHSVAALSAYDLARWPVRVLNDSRQADAQLERMVKAGIVYLDDPFKSRLSPTVEELLFVALDERTSRRKPCVFSFNDSATTLLERLSSDRGKAFLRRIRDFCEVIKPSASAT